MSASAQPSLLFLKLLSLDGSFTFNGVSLAIPSLVRRSAESLQYPLLPHKDWSLVVHVVLAGELLQLVIVDSVVESRSSASSQWSVSPNLASPFLFASSWLFVFILFTRSFHWLLIQLGLLTGVLGHSLACSTRSASSVESQFWSELMLHFELVLYSSVVRAGLCNWSV